MTTNFSRRSKDFRESSWRRMQRCGFWSISTTIESMNLFLSTSKAQTMFKVMKPFSGQSISSGTARQTNGFLRTITRMSPIRARVHVPSCCQSPGHSEILTMERMQESNQVVKPKETQAYARQPLIQSWGSSRRTYIVRSSSSCHQGAKNQMGKATKGISSSAEGRQGMGWQAT